MWYNGLQKPSINFMYSLVFKMHCIVPLNDVARRDKTNPVVNVKCDECGGEELPSSEDVFKNILISV